MRGKHLGLKLNRIQALQIPGVGEHLRDHGATRLGILR